MTPETWKKIGNIVEQALACSGRDREQFLARIYKESPELKAEVTAMLAVYEEDSEFLEAPALEGFTFDPSALPAQQVGPYRVIRKIGQGGMGEVFLAQRETGPVSQPVALKLIRASGHDTDFMLIRFQVEQQILSELTHPNIARLLDADSTEDGRPYFVMEYVDGMPITEYCDHHKLSVEERLNLFVQACNAVQFAHQNFIVHRDLKPGNLLVTETGQVKLLDFGIAKALDPWKANVQTLETRTGFRVLTPTYASPEQIKGQPITTASDVYSLGILLYELLTGSRPYRLAGKLEAEVIRVISEESPTRPSSIITREIEINTEEGDTRTLTPEVIGSSRQISVERLQRKLKGELDNIVLMALRKESDRRYSSAAELGQDIRRHLEGLPVEAQPDSMGYQIRKFVGRHRWGVAGASIITLLLIVFSTVTFIQSSRIRTQSEIISQERDTANEAARQAKIETEKAEEIVEILVGLFETVNPEKVPGGDTLRVTEFLFKSEADVISRLEDRPEIQAKMRHVIGEMYSVQGNRIKSKELITAALEQQLVLKGEQDVEAAEMLKDLAMVHLALNQRDSAITMLETAAGRLTRQDDKTLNQRATTLLTLAPLYPLGEYEKKATMLEEANALIESIDEPDDVQRASAANQLGVFYFNQGMSKEAIEPFRKSLAHLEKAVGTSHPYYLTTAGNLASVLVLVDSFDTARAIHLDILEKRRKNTTKDANIGVAWTLKALGSIAMTEGNWAEAVNYIQDGYDLILKAYSKDHPLISEYATELAQALILQHKHDQARVLLEEAAENRKKHYGEHSVEYAWILHDQAILLSAEQKLEEAHDTIDRTLEILSSFYPDGKNARVELAEFLKGIFYLKQHRPELAYPIVERTLKRRLEVTPVDNSQIQETEMWLGVALSQLGKHEEAGPLLEASRPLLKNPTTYNATNRDVIREAYKNTLNE